MTKFNLCLRRIILPASIALLCACERDAPAGRADTDEDTESAAEDIADAEADAPDAAEDTLDTGEDSAEPEASAPEGAAMSADDAAAPEDAAQREDAAQDAGVEEDAAERADAGVEEDAGPPSDSQFLPWKEGNTWTYRVTNKGKVTTKVVTIMAEETVGGSGPHAGERAFRVVTKKGALDQTISWQALRHESVVRFREQSFHADTGALELEEHWSPYKLHFDGSAAHTAAGGSWYEAYEETKLPASGSPLMSSQRDRWLVDSPEERVTVPAGTFRAVVVMKAAGAELKTYWYARGVGKVKETGGQTEELVSYELSE